jgi:hypothetical protein
MHTACEHRPPKEIQYGYWQQTQMTDQLHALPVLIPVLTIKSTALLVGRSQDRSPVVLLEIISEATDGTMCPGVDSASKNEYQDTPGGEGGRCVRVTTSPPSQGRKSRRSRSLNLLEPQEPFQACNGKPLPLPLLTIKKAG